MYVVRHGQASGNNPEAPLTDFGLLHAEQLALFLDQKLEINDERLKIISSPYLRTTQTAGEISRVLNKKYDTDSRLIELIVGEIADFSEEEFQKKLKEQFENNELPYLGGESNLEVTNRIKKLLADLKSSIATTVMIMVTHRVTITLLLKEFKEDIGYKECIEMTNPDVYLVETVNRDIQVKRIWEAQL